CESFTLNGETFTESGTYTQNLVGVNGCDSTLTLHLTINQPTTSEITETACESFTLNGETFTESGIYTQKLVNVNGCDSTLTLHLTINHPTSAEITETACESFTLNGETFTESGIFTQNLVAANGCDSTLILHLTINQPTSAELYLEAISSFSANGEVFYESGTYIQSLVNRAGCDSLLILHLTISQANTIKPQDDYYKVVEDSENNRLQMLENDIFDGFSISEVSIQIDNQPISGNLIVSDNNTPSNPFDDYLLYTPGRNHHYEESFEYTITDKTGNKTSAMVYITIIPNPLFIPEGFSPNGDGINDQFIIKGLYNYPNNSLLIFDKTGKTVFEATPYQSDWSGENIHNSEALQQDTYFYILNLGNGLAKRKGFVYLIR
ncbi:MAG: gliding motility-associated C-terminal domain-containing protein, partial [Bacteroidales bacterium]|nr:gliding motility-associated C-terminal domain-containing protein [Bacteroidales bacterium]